MTKSEKYRNPAALEAGQCDPFAVDDGWLLTGIPSVAAVQAALLEAGSLPKTQPLNPVTAKRWLPPSIDPATRTFNDEVLPHALRFRARSDQAPEAADAQLQEHIVSVDKKMAYATGAVIEVVSYARSETAKFETFRRAGEEMVSAVDTLEPTAAFRYELTKLIATTVPRPLYSSFEWPARNVFACLLFLGRSALPAQLAEMAQSGSFDGFIATDLVRFASNHPVDTRDGVRPVADLLRFSRAFSPNTDETTIRTRMAAGYRDWPKDQADTFTNGRERLLAGYARTVSWVRSPAGAGDYLQITTNHSDPAAALTMALRKYFAQARQQPFGNKRQTHAPAGPTNRQRRRQTAKRADRMNLTEVFEAMAPEKAVPNWELAALRPDGSVESGEGADAVIAGLRQDYLDEYKTPANHPIVAVVEKILEDVRHLDFSTGSTPGVKKLTPAAIKVGNNTDTCYALMEYKPKQVPGASLKVEDADKLRVLFALTGPNTLGLLRVLKRPDITDYLRRVGVSGYTTKD